MPPVDKEPEKEVYYIKFNFEAEEAQELSVSEGEKVKAELNAETSSEPWTLVDSLTPPYSRGFVPTSFLVPVRVVAPPPPSRTTTTSSRTPTSNTPRKQQQQQQQEWDNETSSQRSYDSLPRKTVSSAPSASKLKTVRRLSDPRLAEQLLDVLAIHPPEDHIGSSSSRGGGGATSNALALAHHAAAPPPPVSHHGEYQHLLAQHDRQFQQVMHQRHTQFKHLDDAAGELRRKIDGNKQKASEISAHLLDLASIVEAERRKWKDKLNEQSTAFHNA